MLARLYQMIDLLAFFLGGERGPLRPPVGPKGAVRLDQGPVAHDEDDGRP